jgi:ubiquitin C-terminal hydrolase
LFFISLSPKSLTSFLNSHPAGGLPTWLLEVGSASTTTIISLASLSHYYHFGRAFCPAGLPQSSHKKRKFAVNSKVVMEWTSHILNHNQVAKKPGIEVYGKDAGLSPMSANGHAATGDLKSPKQRRRGSEAKDDALVAALSNIKREDTVVMQYLQAVRDGKVPVDDKSVDSFEADPNAEDLWTMEQLVDWADKALDDAALNTIFYRLVGSGVLPSSASEKELVQEAWKEWEASDIRLWSEGDVSDSLDLFSKSVKRFFAASSAAENGDKLKADHPAWGGIGGFDGKGGLGYGIMYCVDKKWWDSWAAYTGWAWDGEFGVEPKSTTRPGDLSSERLLDRYSDISVAGALGSYEIMKQNVKKDVDYVVVPPSVWNVLYEMYGGGPPLPRMVLPPQRMDLRSSSRPRAETGDSKQMEYEDDLLSGVEVINSNMKLMRIPEAFAVATHPWVLHCSLCDASQPYRRGDAGPMSIRIMATPDQPLWRLYAEILVRLPTQNQRAVGPDGRGKGRLWKHIDNTAPKDQASRYGPWIMLCKNRFATLPINDLDIELEKNYQELAQDWQTFSDQSTVEGCGLSNGDRIMFEFAVLNKTNEFVWPREAAAKAGRIKRNADEDKHFRQILRGFDDKGNVVKDVSKSLVGMAIDAMDSSGRWYQVNIVQLEQAPAQSEVDDEDEEGESAYSLDNLKPGEVRLVKVDFPEGHSEWIEVASDTLAVAGRFTLKEDDASTKASQTNATDAKAKTTAAGKKVDAADQSAGKICTLPGYGACGLANLGNTCYANSAIQCISYMPLLRSYLLSAQYKASGDLNKDNPLGTGGKLLEEFADLLRIMWSGKYGERSPTRFRGQLGKQRSQFSGSDQQDAQELLNYMLDVLHEDSNKVKRKPYVEALEDDWVKSNSLARVGEESWRRFLRRNRSIMADVAMGQVLNTVTCPVCDFSSRIFDPFNLLSIPFPTVADVVFLCTVVRRATPLNCPKILNAPRKNKDEAKRYNIEDLREEDVEPPSEQLVLEEYVIPMSRLADIGDLRLRLQNISGVAANRFRLCKAEDLITDKDLDNKSPVRLYTRVTSLPDKEGPCVQVAKNAGATDEVVTAPTAPTRIFAFENTISPRPMPQLEAKEGENEGDEDTVTDDDDEEEAPQEKNYDARTAKETRVLKELLSVYGDGKECRVFDTDPLPISKAISRSLWPELEGEFKLGLRVDAIDHRNHWFPGSVVEIIEGVANENHDPTPEGETATKTKVRIHFDNFSSKWDETYTIDHFTAGKVRPLYSHATPRPKPTDFMVHHRYSAKASNISVLFGMSFFLSCSNEWSTARAGAHILAQASRYLQKANVDHSGPVDVDEIHETDCKVLRLYEKAHSAISELIDLLLECDRNYVRSALGIGNDGPGETEDFINLDFDATSMSAVLVKKVGALLHRLPFELKVCTADSLMGNKNTPATEEVPFPFSLMRTIGNYMNARHAVILHWRDPPVDKKSKSGSVFSAPVMYVQPTIAIHKSSSELLEEGSHMSKNSPGNGGLHLNVCLKEFCKVNQLHLNDNWRCPRCKEYREGNQNMVLWRLPDLLTFHVKRFNCSARWREKITTKVNFPLTGLDMSEWCHPESPALTQMGPDSQIYDLIAVVNHYGGMTGGHYVATCKATPCGPLGSEEVSYQFNGMGASCNTLAEDEGILGTSSAPSAGWRLGRKDKESVNQHKLNAALAARNVCESAEPLWLQFDDDLVEPIPPRNVVSEMAYVLFYRRRKMTPSNIAKYSTIE